MGLNLEQKQTVVAEVAKQLVGAQAIVLAENRGMAVAAMTQLRAKARASGVYFRVMKNTLVRRAVADTPFADRRGWVRPRTLVVAGAAEELAMVKRARLRRFPVSPRRE